MEEKVFFDGEFGKICGVLHKVDDTSEIVIIVHGFSTNKDTSALPISIELNKVGVNALRIDLDNRGESELDFETGISVPNYIKQVEAAMNYCKSLGYKEISLIGTSYGGMVMFGVAMSHPEIKRLVLRVPVVDYKEHVKKKYTESELREYERTGLIPKGKTDTSNLIVTFDYIKKSYPYSMYDHAREIKVPTLIIQGDKDESVNPESAKKVVKFFPNAKIHIIKGAGHDLGVDGDYSEGHRVLTDFFKNSI